MAFDGHTYQLGADASIRDARLPRQLNSISVNRVYRRGRNTTRPPFVSLELSGNKEAIRYFQNNPVRATHFYERVRPGKQPALIIYVGDALIKARLYASTLELSFLRRGLATNVQHGFFVQAEDYLFFQNGIDTPIMFDGFEAVDIVAGLKLQDQTELSKPMPIGNIMKYAHGRLWVGDSKNQLYASNHLYANGFGELSPVSLGNFSESEYPSSGGSFTAPAYFGQLTGIEVIPRHPSINGHGELIALHQRGAYAINPTLPRNQWSDEPIQNVILVGRGCVSPHSVVPVNNDIWYRSFDLGVSSFKHSVTQFRESWGDKSLSKEAQLYLDFDNGLFAEFTRAIKTKSRLMFTCAHRQEYVDERDVADRHYANGIVVIDFDSGSTVVPTIEFSWDGLWTGPRVVDVATVFESNIPRYLFTSYDKDGLNRVYELKETSQGNDQIDGEEKKIESFYVIENLFSQLNTAEEKYQKKIKVVSLEVEDLIGKVEFGLEYKPDNYNRFSSIMEGEARGADPSEIEQDDLDSRHAVYYGTIVSPSADFGTDEVYGKGYWSQEGFDFIVKVKGYATVKTLTVEADPEKAEVQYEDGRDFDFTKGTTSPGEPDRIFQYQF